MLIFKQSREKHKLPSAGQASPLFIIWPLALLIFLLLSGCAPENSNGSLETAGNRIEILVAPEFQSFYERYGGLRVFGQPLTDAYIELGGDRQIQYFRALRLEYDPELDQVFITPLGQWTVPDEENQIPAPDSADDLELSDDREEIPIRDEFFNFYELYGGEPLFGLPISYELDEGGTRTQYFENTRLEWHPGKTIGNRVQVGPLGEEHYRQVGVFQNPGRSRPLDSAAVREAVISTHFQSSILYDGDEQVIFVDIKTPEGQQPVSDVFVELAIFYNGLTETDTLSATDGSGHTQGVVKMPGVEPGQKVQVTVSAFNAIGETIGKTTNSFMTWW